MTAAETDDLASVLEIIERWPETLRLELARQVLKNISEPIFDTPPRRLPPDEIIRILRMDSRPSENAACLRTLPTALSHTAGQVSLGKYELDPRRGRHWQLWCRGGLERQIEGITPLLASWESKTNPAQVRLQAWLDSVMAQLLPLPGDVPLYLHLDVDVGDPRRLLRHHDLENYLTPLFGSGRLPSCRFVLVSARKHVGGGSRICVGRADPQNLAEDLDWTFFSTMAGSGASRREWKERIFDALATSALPPVAPGRAQVRLAWRCSSGRNWTSLWKPTGDAMGPILGTPDPQKPFQLNDDRIVDLELHRNDDDSLAHDVVVGMWWRGLDAVS